MAGPYPDPRDPESSTAAQSVRSADRPSQRRRRVPPAAPR
jgi:hypothetical protein